MKKTMCPYCFGGEILDETQPNIEEIEQEMDRLCDSGHFSYIDAFARVTRKKGRTKKCPKCNGTGELET